MCTLAARVDRGCIYGNILDAFAGTSRQRLYGFSHRAKRWPWSMRFWRNV